MFFASLIIEREPLQWQELPGSIAAWFKDAGGVAQIACLIFLAVSLAQLISGAKINWKRASGLRLLAVLVVVAQVFYLGFLFLLLIQGPQFGGPELLRKSADRTMQRLPNAETVPITAYTLQDWLLTLGGACALLAFTLPILLKLKRLSWRRIGALARLSFKEALHRRVVWVFWLMGIVFLFAGWFIPYKPEDQVRTYVEVVYFGMSVLLWLTGSLLGAFSIPRDVRDQTIHTIVTKPVERFEIVLGRMLGYAGLLTVVLAVLTGLSLVYVVRGVTEDAKTESYKARVPVFGELSFFGTKENKGESVGREWEYRKYLPGPNPTSPNQQKPYAIWSFASLPAGLAQRDQPVPVEFTFDIFRTTKGDLNRGVFCTFTFASGHLPTGEIERRVSALRLERPELLKKVRDLRLVEDQLIAKYGVYEDTAIEAFDYHTQSTTVPASLLKKAIEDGDRERNKDLEANAKEREDLERARPNLSNSEYQRRLQQQTETEAQRAGKPYLKVLVNINQHSHNQLLGVARRDLYLLANELPFWQNFIKGSIGLWFSMMLLLGVAVACSTYLSGIISWIVAMVLFILGFFLEEIRRMAEGIGGGGPMESSFRFFNRLNMNAPMEDSPTKSLAQSGDELFRLWLRQFLKIIPDVNRFDLTTYVGSGFDIPWIGVLLLDNLLPLVAYLLPWLVLSYYLMELREVANPS
jgi:hypothetical protein